MATTRAPLRRLVVTVTVGSFSVAALLGVVALLSGGEFGQTQVRVLLTTLVVGVTSVAVLCYLATAGTAYAPVGALGGVVVLVPLATALVLVWGRGDRGGDVVVEAFGVGAILAATLAQACLLLVLAGRRGPGLRVLLALTLVLAGLLAAVLSALVLGVDADDEVTARMVGVVAILDVLGTVVVAALARFGGDPRTADPAGRTAGGSAVTVPADLLAEVDRLAAARGSTREAVVEDALRAHVDAHARPAGP